MSSVSGSHINPGSEPKHSVDGREENFKPTLSVRMPSYMRSLYKRTNKAQHKTVVDPAKQKGAGVDFVGFSYSTHTDGLVKPGAKDELLEGVYLKDPVFRLPSKTKMISKSAGHRKYGTKRTHIQRPVAKCHKRKRKREMNWNVSM